MSYKQLCSISVLTISCWCHAHIDVLCWQHNLPLCFSHVNIKGSQCINFFFVCHLSASTDVLKLFVWNWNYKLWLALFTLSHYTCKLVVIMLQPLLKKHCGDTMVEWWYQVIVLRPKYWFPYTCTMVFKQYSKVLQTIQNYYHGTCLKKK